MKFLKFGVKLFFIVQLWPSQHLLVQSPRWKHQNNVFNMFNVKNKGTRTTLLWTDFMHFFEVFIVDFEQVNNCSVWTAAFEMKHCGSIFTTTLHIL